MSSKWKKVKLTDITQNLNYKRVPLSSVERLKKQGMYPYYGASGIVDYINDYIFDGRYLLISEDGENLRSRKTPIAFQAIGKFWVNNHAHILKEKEEGILDYLEYYFSILDLTPYITGAVQPKLNKRNLEDIDFFIPHKKIRLKINKILNSFTNKITLNNQINETLEAMAQAIFKSWFIDFEPVKAKIEAKDAGQDAEGILLAAMSAISGKDSKALKTLQTTAPEEYAELKAIAEQFPDSLEESELGMIPKGWEVVIAEDLYEITIGRTPPRKEKQWFSLNDHDIKWLSIKDLGQNGIYIMQTNEKLTYEAIEKFRINVLPQNTVFLSFKMTIGRVGIANERMCTNEAIAHFVPLDEIPYEWTYLYLTHFNYDSLGSTSSIATAINSKIIRQMRLLMPTSNLLEIFRLKISYIFQKIRSIGIENQTLTELRDTLLPKLLSGEIDVSNVAIDELLENEA